MRRTAWAVGILVFAAASAFADKKLDDAVAKAEEQLQKGKPDEALKGLQKAVQSAPSSDGYLQLARLQERLGQFDEAGKSLTAAVGAASAPAAKSEALAAQSSLALVTGTGKDALAHAQEAVKAQESPAALAALARAQIRMQDPVAALAAADKAIAVGAGSAVAHEAKGEALLANHRRDEALASFRKALELDPKWNRARLGLSSALTGSGKHADAVAEARKVTAAEEKNAEAYAVLGLALLAENDKNFGGAIAEAQQGAFLNAKSVNAHIAVARIFEAAGNLDQALAAYERAGQIDPIAIPGSVQLQRLEKQYPLKTILDQFEKAKTAPDWTLDKGRALLANDKGWQEYKKLLEKYPQDGLIQTTLIRQLFAMGDYKNAAAVAKNVVKTPQKEAFVYVIAAAGLHRAGEVEAARDAYKRAVELDPKNANYRSSYALLLGLNSQYDEGIAELVKVTATAGYKDSAGFTNLGWLYRNHPQKKMGEAVVAYRKALELDPKNGQAALGLGWALSYEQKYDEAIPAFQKAAQIEPSLTSDAMNGAAWCYFFKQDMGQAAAFLDKAQAGGRSDPRLRDNIAKMEKLKEQKQAYEQALRDYQEQQKKAGGDVGALARQIRGGDPATKLRAIRAVGDLSGAEAVNALIPALDDGSAAVRQAAAEELGGMGPAAKSAVPYVMEMLKAECGKTIMTNQEMTESMKCEDAKKKAREALGKINR